MPDVSYMIVIFKSSEPVVDHRQPVTQPGLGRGSDVTTGRSPAYPNAGCVARLVAVGKVQP
jgi:hypothetical protein